VELLLADLRDAEKLAAQDGVADPPAQQLSRAVRDKLWALYRPSEDAEYASFDPFNLVEPPEIKFSLDTGFTELTCANLKDFQKHVARYLDSQHRFWPIVKSVQVRGPFAPLRDGAKIIDLPGLNDPNEAREQVTRMHLKECRFVWIVFNIRRGLTKDIVSIMQTDDFLRRIVMDGRAHSLTFVGTVADELGDLSAAARQFALAEDAPELDIITARNREVRRHLRTELKELAYSLAESAKEGKETADKLAAALRSSKVFTVSSLEYLRLLKLSRAHPKGLTNLGQTEIPGLQEHMHRICATHGVAMHCQTLNRQLELILADVEAELRSHEASIKNRLDISERGQKEMRAAVDAARSFLERDLDSVRELLAQDLESAQATLAERLKRAVERAKQELDQTFLRWERIHHLTLRAVCRRGGVHVGTHRNDFPADLSKPILDGIAFAWSDFFGERLHQSLEKWTERLLRQSQEYRTRLRDSVAAVPDLGSNVLTNLQGIFVTTEKVLRELLAQTNNQMDAKIQHEQRTLYESIPGQVRANMEQAFQDAADEKGAGMKRRIVEVLARHAREVSNVMFDDARDAIVNGVRKLNDWLTREFTSMIEAIIRNAGLAAQNLVAGRSDRTAEAMAAEQKLLGELAGILERLQQKSAA